MSTATTQGRGRGRPRLPKPAVITLRMPVELHSRISRLHEIGSFGDLSVNKFLVDAVSRVIDSFEAVTAKAADKEESR